MVRIEEGMLARSLAGHDRDRLYVIIRRDAEYVWLVDGISRTVEKPKKKEDQAYPGHPPAGRAGEESAGARHTTWG